MLDNDGIVAEVLFPDGVTEMNAPPFGAGFGMQPGGANSELMWAGCDAHNRFMSEFVQTAPERRIGLACIPVYWDVDLAVEKAKEARRNGLAGVLLPPMCGDFPAYHYSQYDPFWAVCQELEMPVHFHSGPAPMQEFFGPMPPPEGQAIPEGAVGSYLMEVEFLMKVSVDQYCINVTDLEKSVDFYEKTLGLTITHRIEEKEFREVVLAGESGNRIQLAWQRNQEGPIVHGNGFWKLYLQTDDCKGLYQRCIDAGAESVMEPQRLEEWPVTAAFVKDPDGYLVEFLETHGEAATVSGSESH